MGLPEIPLPEDNAPEDWVRREMEQRGIYNPLPGQEQEYIDWATRQGPHPDYNPGPHHGRNYPPGQDNHSTSPEELSPDFPHHSTPSSSSALAKDQTPSRKTYAYFDTDITIQDHGRTSRVKATFINIEMMGYMTSGSGEGYRDDPNQLLVIVNGNHAYGGTITYLIKNSGGNIAIFPEVIDPTQIPPVIRGQAIIDAASQTGPKMADIVKGNQSANMSLVILNSHLLEQYQIDNAKRIFQSRLTLR